MKRALILLFCIILCLASFAGCAGEKYNGPDSEYNKAFNKVASSINKTLNKEYYSENITYRVKYFIDKENPEHSFFSTSAEIITEHETAMEYYHSLSQEDIESFVKECEDICELTMDMLSDSNLTFLPSGHAINFTIRAKAENDGRSMQLHYEYNSSALWYLSPEGEMTYLYGTP